jgi:hypothetical protein
MSANDNPTYVTVVDDAYFLGAVALVNSLRVTGNAGPIVVLDAGLTDAQKRSLAAECEVRPVPVDRSGTLPFYFKPTIAMLGLQGVVAYLDSDMLVTASLEPLLEAARRGQFCAFPDTSCPDRRYVEWQANLGLAAEPREQPYLQAGFVAFDLDAWQTELHRWWELCDRGRLQRSDVEWGIEDPHLAEGDPLFWGDQDVLNAILMSEVEQSRISFLDAGLVGVSHWPYYDRGSKIVNRRTLAVAEDGRAQVILHYWDHPKPWMPGARTKLTSEAFVELTARLLTADDVPVSLPSSIVPVWLRDDVAGKLVRRGPHRARLVAKKGVGLLPDPVEMRVRAVAQRLRRTS